MEHADFEKLLKEADNLTSKGKYEEAVDIYMQALSLEPIHPQVNHQLVQVLIKSEHYEEMYQHFIQWSEILHQMGKEDEAQKILQEAVNIDSPSGKKFAIIDKKSGLTQAHKEVHSRFSPHLYFLLGKITYERNSFDETIAYLNKSLEYSAANADARLLLGLTYLEKGMDEKAKGEFQEVVRLAPDNAALAYEKLAEIYSRQGKAIQNIVVFLKNAADTYHKKNQPEEALRVYQNILQYEPNNKDVLERLVKVYVEKELINDAIQIYKHLAEVYTKEGLFDRVIHSYEKLLELESDNIEIRNKIIEMYRTGLKIDPSNLSARHRLIENLIGKGSTEEIIPEFLALITTYIDKGLLREAIEYCQQLMKLDPNNLKALALFADLELKTGNHEAAKITYVDLIKKLENAGRKEEAYKVAENLLAAIPADTELMMMLGEHSLAVGDDDTAATRFQSVYELNPNNLMALTYVGELFQRKGEKEKAQVLYEKILQQNPNFTPAKERLGLLYEQIGEPEKIRETLGNAAAGFMEKQNFTSAIPLLRKLLAMYPEDLSFRIALFTALLGTGDLNNARLELWLLSRLLMKCELAMKALELLQQYLEKAPFDLNSRACLAKAAMEIDQRNIASKEYLTLATQFTEHLLPQKAIQVYKNLIILEPANFIYHKYLGELLVKENKVDEALAHYLALEEQYEQQNMPQEAKEISTQILFLDPHNKNAAIKLAQLFLAEGTPEESFKVLKTSASQAKADGDYITAIQLYDKIAEIYAGLGQQNKKLETRLLITDLHFEFGNETEGIRMLHELAGLYLANSDMQSYNKCIKKSLTRPYYYDNKEESISIYNKAILGVLPKDLSLGLALVDEAVKVLLESGKVELLANFTDSVGENLSGAKEASAFYQKMAETATQIYHLDESIKYYEKVANIAPSSPDAYLCLGKLYAAKDQTQTACEAYIKAIDLYLVAAMLDDAQKTVLQVEIIASRSPEIQTRIGELFLRYNHWNLAKKYYENALQYNENFIPALLGIAAILAKTRKTDELVALIRTLVPKGCVAEVLEEYKNLLLVSITPGMMALELGNLYMELGFHEEAINEFVDAMKDPASFLDGVRSLGTFFAEQGFLDLGIRQLQIGITTEYGEEDLLSIRYSLAEIYEQGHLFKESLDLYNEIYAVDIRFRDVEQKMPLLNKRLQQESDSKIVSFLPDKGERI